MNQPSHSLQPTRILLVDDEQDILDILVRVLQNAGYEVDTASNGQEALQQVACQNYDLIITNVRMPVLDGRAFYRRLRGFYPHLSRRVIFCTGDTADADTRSFLNASGAPVIFKPFALNAMLELVSYQLTASSSPVKNPALPRAQPKIIIAPAL